MSRPDGRYLPIESYAVIGDLQTVALVGLDGCIDFLCLPRFDSPSVFAALLDAEKGGRFAITPELTHARHKQLYMPDTNILLTRFLSDQGVAEISDFMPIHTEQHSTRLVRRVKTVRGEIRFRVHCAPRFDYARAHPHRRAPNRAGRASPEEALVLRLSSTVPASCEGGDAFAEVTLRPDETATFILEQVTEDTVAPDRPRPVRRRVVQGDDELLARVGRPIVLQRGMAGRGEPLGARAQAPLLP